MIIYLMELECCCLAICNAIVQELLDSDDEDPNIVEKNENFAEFTIYNFEDNQFKEHFRLLPSTFEVVLNKIRTANRNTMTMVGSGHPEIDFIKQLLITLWCLANIESFRSVADRFGIAKSACWRVLYRTSHRLLRVNSHYGVIAFPTENRLADVANSFENIAGFPGVVGAVDGCHIRIEKPRNSPNSYINRKGYPSVLLQGVCDSKKIFTDVYAGEPGSLNDNRLFANSSLYSRIQNREIQLPNNYHLIGDLAYRLSLCFMVGFKDNGHLTRPQVNFNKVLSRTRVVIENSFGLLKGRFRRLKFMETRRLDLISLLIVVACILHNICLLHGDIMDFPPDDDNHEGNHEIDVNVEGPAAVAKRSDIMNLLFVNNND